MRYLVLTVLVFVLFAVQAPVVKALGWGAASVDVALLAVLYLAATSPAFGGFVTSVVLGLVADSFTPGGVLGMYMEVAGIVFLVGRGLADRLQILRPVPLMVIVLVCMVTKTLLVFLLSIVFDRDFTQYAAVFVNVLPHVLTTTILAPVFVALFQWTDRRVRGRRPVGTLLR